MTGVEYESPTPGRIPHDHLEQLRAWLELQRFGIVRAHHVVEIYPEEGDEPPTRQETLVFELEEWPDWTAPRELWMAVSMEAPSIDLRGKGSWGYTFASRQHARYSSGGLGALGARPACPETCTCAARVRTYAACCVRGFVSALRRELAQWADVRSAYAATERRLKDGIELSSDLRFRLEGRRRSRETSRPLLDSVSDVIRGWFPSFGLGIHPEDEGNLEAREHGLLLCQREPEQ